MQRQTTIETAETTLPTPVEEIARAYLCHAKGDAALALRSVVTDALFDILEAEHRLTETRQLISSGFVRGGGPAF